MHQQQAETPYEGQAVTYGFTEVTIDNQHLVGHSRAIRGYGSSLELLPGHNTGYFFTFNAECFDSTACEIIPEFRRQIIARFLR